MNISRAYYIFCLGVTFTYAEPRVANENYDPSSYSQENENKNYELYTPTKEYLDLANKDNAIRSVIEDNRHIQEEFKALNLNKVSSSVKIKNIMNMDHLVMHTEYPLIIMLPLNTNITNAYCYPPTVKPIYQFNRIDLIPSDELLKTSLVVSYIDGNEPKMMTILLSKIKNNTGTLLQREVRYIKRNILGIEDVLTRYYTAYNKYPINNSMIRIGRNVYTFIEDRINGTLRIDNSKFLMKIN
ncbi:MAG TPA: hypothetical protein EYG73_00155 [Arcobacter sp.]|nr:hypothetical protein [Arcobacter sp.]